MRQQKPIIKGKLQLNFRQWSRKGYAVFASLGQLVRIATLKTVVSAKLVCKSAVSIAILPTQSNEFDNQESDLVEEALLPFFAINQSIVTILNNQPATVGGHIIYNKIEQNPVGYS